MTEPGPLRTPAAPRRPTLALVTDNIHLGVGATLWAGAVAAAERGDADLVALPGGALRPGSPRNALYDLISPDRLDGVVCWTSTLNLPAVGDRAQWLLRRLRRLPVVSLNQDLDGHEALLLDGYAGMREAVGHLVGDHGRRRPACVRGPLTNPVSLDRYRAYTHALARHRIPLDHALVTEAADFGGGAGARAMRVLLDIRRLRPGRDFDAVVACSDVLAADALRCLTERGVRVPEDVAVVGFNDSVEARLADPPLTSVSLPFTELGALAVETLLARLRGTVPPVRTAVPGTLVTRRSCGCHSPLVVQGAGDDACPKPPKGPFADCPGGAAELDAAFHADVSAASGERPPGAFLPLLEAVVARAVRDADDVRAWDAALLRARRLALPPLPDDARPRGERLLGQARLMVADKSRKLLEYARWADEQEARRLRELGTALTTAPDIDALTGALADRLPAMGVRGCRIVLYDDGAGAGAVRPVPTPQERAAGAAGAPAGGEPVAVAGALRYAPVPPPEEDRRFTLVAEPLHVGDESLGFALFDAGSRQGAATRGALYRALGDQVSAALKGIRLLDEVQRARDAAERASRLKTRLLDNATDELRTPVEEILRRTGTGTGTSTGPDRADHRRAGHGRHGPGRSGHAPHERDRGERDRADLLRTVHADASRLLGLIDDLLDLSRSEIDSLDLSRQLLDPRPLLAEAFAEVAGGRHGASRTAAGPPRGAARPGPGLPGLRLPRRLPAVCADPARLRQILVALLTAAAGPPGGPAGVALAAEVRPPVLRVRVRGPGLAVPREDAERLLEPFASAAPGARPGPAVARRLAVLHGGSVSLYDAPGGSGFRLELPLPTPADTPGPVPGLPDGPPRRTLYVASSAALDDTGAGETDAAGAAEGAGVPERGDRADRGGHARDADDARAPAPAPVPALGPPEAAGLARRHGWRIHRPHPDDDLAALPAARPPAAVAWDTADVHPHAWACVRALHDHPACRRTPFLLYGHVTGRDLDRALGALRPAALARPVVVADGSADERRRLRRLLAAALPGRAVRGAAD
uniref:substrate-binding domain-containing protein n=1 Tax=Streptomyces chilikensis TaxID=1194079 RepID=UPI0014093E26